MSKRLAIRLAGSIAAALLGCAAEFHAGPMPGEPKDASYLAVDGARVRFTDEGEGPAVVLIHGFASSLETWAAVAPKLVAAHHRVLALDLKGFGWTDRPPGDYSPAAEAKLVLDLMSARGIERATVVGHSFGCSVALMMALLAPERVERLALYSAWVYEDQLPAFFQWARADGIGEALFAMFYGQRPDERISAAFYDQTKVTEKLVEDVERALERPGTYAAALAAARGQRFSEIEPEYRTLAQPTLLLWGREDAVSLLRFGERLERDLRNARLVVFGRCGHFPMLEAAGASNAELLRFVDAPIVPEPAPSPSARKGAR